MCNIFTQSYKMMGTIINVQIEAFNASYLMNEVNVLLQKYNKMFSANDSNSELMKINNAAGKHKVCVNEQLYSLLKLGIKHSTPTNSAMNIAIGPLTQLWRIGFNDANIPSNSDIKNQLKLVNIENVITNDIDNSVYLKQAGMKIDLGCIAKGYIADLIIAYLKDNNVKSAMINLGGNVLVYGPAPNRDDCKWKIGIRDPKDKNLYRKVLKIQNQSIVTSGIYERSYLGNHHILSDIDGYPIQTDVASISIISEKSVDCEIWTSRLFNLNSDEIISAVKNITHIEAIVIRRDGTMVSSMERIL